MTLRLELHKVIVFIFFVIFLGVGLFCVKDYGISWDECQQRDLGIHTVNYVVKGDQSLLQFRDRFYGPFFEAVLAVLEQGLHLDNNDRALFAMRHLVTFLLFYLGVIFFYKLCQRIFSSWRTGLLGCLFLILSPRIFADAFYNSKDIPCLSVFIISTFTLINYLENKTFVKAFIHAFVSAALIDIRIVGILIPFLTLFFTAIDICTMHVRGTSLKKVSLSFIAYGLFVIMFTIIFWPFLWASPLNNFMYALWGMSHFTGGTVLYLGQYLDVTRLPWHYIPVWMAVTTPLIYVIAFCIGYVKTIVSAGRNPAGFYRTHKSNLIILLLISLPIAAVILFRPGLYDAWRQMFYVYPAFLVLSIIGLRALFDFVRLKAGSILIEIICLILILLNLSCVVLFMIRNHPYQNVYFNSLAGRTMKEIKAKFELDYWGLSFTKALEYIVKNDPDPFIKIYVDHHPPLDTQMLNDNDRQRLIFVNNYEEAKYFMSNYRWHKEEYTFENEYYAIKVEGVPIAVVYRL